ncbi:cytochrome c oxidase subunit II [Anaerolineales bacterium]
MHIDKYERTWLIVVVIVLACFFAALTAGFLVYGVRLPSSDEGGFVIPAQLSNEPGYSDPGLREIGDKKYELYIIAKKWRFDVGTDHEGTTQNPILRVPVGSSVKIHISSEDTTHGFIIEDQNVNIELVPGHLAQLTAHFKHVGEFGVVCHEFCGISHHNMWMTIEVYDPAAVNTGAYSLLEEGEV